MKNKILKRQINLFKKTCNNTWNASIKTVTNWKSSNKNHDKKEKLKKVRNLPPSCYLIQILNTSTTLNER
jgi:hypothetical protein